MPKSGHLPANRAGKHAGKGDFSPKNQFFLLSLNNCV